MIYADFESISIPENNEKQNSEEADINKYQKHIVGVGDKFSKPLRHIQAKMQFTVLLIIRSKKVNITWT